MRKRLLWVVTLLLTVCVIALTVHFVWCVNRTVLISRAVERHDGWINFKKWLPASVEERLNSEVATALGSCWHVSVFNPPLEDSELALIVSAPSLTGLELYTAVAENGLRHLEKCLQLEELGFTEARLSANDLACVARIQSLKRLSLLDCQIDDLGVSELAKLEHLEMLLLFRTHVTDEGVQSLAKCSKLIELGLEQTKISDNCLPSLQKIRSLRKLSLHGTHVTAAGVQDLERARPDLTVNWGDKFSPETEGAGFF